MGLLLVGGGRSLGLVLVHRGGVVVGAGVGGGGGSGHLLRVAGVASGLLVLGLLVLGLVDAVVLGLVLGGAGCSAGELGEVRGLSLGDLGRVDHRAVLADGGGLGHRSVSAWGTGVLGLAGRYSAGEEYL